MNEYHFYYTDEKYLKRLMIISFCVLIGMLFSIIISIEWIGLGGGILLAFSVASIVFIQNRHKVKKEGSAIIHDSFAELRLADKTKIDYLKILSIKMGSYNGTDLTVELNDKTKFYLRANVNYSDPNPLTNFCSGLLSSVIEFAKRNNLEMITSKKMFEQKLIFKK